MSDKDNNQQPTQPQTKITSDIFVKPTMSTENRGGQNSCTNAIITRRH